MTEKHLFDVAVLFMGAVMGFLGSYYGMAATVKTTLEAHKECLVALDDEAKQAKSENVIEFKRLYDKIGTCQEKREADKFESRINDNLKDINSSIKDLAGKFEEFLINERKAIK